MHNRPFSRVDYSTISGFISFLLFPQCDWTCISIVSHYKLFDVIQEHVINEIPPTQDKYNGFPNEHFHIIKNYIKIPYDFFLRWLHCYGFSEECFLDGMLD